LVPLADTGRSCYNPNRGISVLNSSEFALKAVARNMPQTPEQ
jgi:hypothetical protein